MAVPTFTAKDFKVFTVPGLEPRMTALIEQVRPKLHRLGDELAPWLTTICGEPMYPHVARHARRTINPPDDSWVAWSSSKKGYKALPHFQVGLWSTHLFIQFAIIYECENKTVFAERVLERLPEVRRLVPDTFFWSGDHMDPANTPDRELSDEQLAGLLERLRSVKQAELLCGLELKRGDARLSSARALSDTIESTFEAVLPLYRLAR